MTRPETEGSSPGEGAEGTEVRPGTGVVRPGSGQGAAGAAGVVRPPAAPPAGIVLPATDVVRPGTDVVRPAGTAEGAAKAVAAVPEAPEAPLEPIHVVLPVIPVKPAKQGFLDRLVAGKSEAEKAAEEARKAEEAQRKAEEKARKHAEEVRKAKAEARRKAEETARKRAEQEAEAEERARKKTEEKARKQAEAQRERQAAQERADQARRERALQRSREDVDDEGLDEPEAPAAPPRPAPPRPAPARPGGPRPGPGPGMRLGPARPMPGGRPAPARGYDERYGGRRTRRPLWQWVVAAMAVVALGGGSAAVAGVVAPATVVRYQPGLDTPDPAPVLGRLDGGAALPSASGLEAALGPLLGAAGLGPRPAMAVGDPATGTVLWERRGDDVVIPASAAKVLTAMAVLATRGPNYRIPTQVKAGANPGDVVLVGGGDPSLATGEVSYYRGAARLDDLAEQVLAALGGNRPNRVLIDGSRYDGPTVGPSGPGNLGSAITHITPLMIDAGHSDPAYRGDHPRYHDRADIAAGRAFAAALGLDPSQVVPGQARPDAEVLGEVLSPPMASIVEQMLANSDNVTAEMLAREVADAKGMPLTFAGAAQATREVLADLGLPMPPGTGLTDGSGLSREDRVTVKYLLSLLTLAASPEHPELRSLVSGLAVAGYSGTLDDRGRAGRGIVRAKTGTLSGINALVGFVVDEDGRLLAFAAIANGTPSQFSGEAALDRLVERVTRCGCG